MMQRLLVGAMLLCVLMGCDDQEKHSSSPAVVQEHEQIFFDPGVTSVTLISENKYLVTLTVDTTVREQPYMAWVAGLVERRGDTMFIDFPDDTTQSFKRIDCKYFFADTTQQPPTLQFKQDLNALFKLHLKMPCDSFGEMTMHYGRTKAVVSGNVIRFL